MPFKTTATTAVAPAVPVMQTCCDSTTCCVPQAGAAALGIPLYQHIANLASNTQLVLPVPSFNVINGGVHAGNALAPQEFMILPVG